MATGFKSNAAVSFDNETLKYVVTYKWGLIHKDAGDVTLRLHRSGNHYDIRMVAHSRSWADRIYRVRDTLFSTIRVADLKPVYYAKHMHEKNKHRIDEIKYKYSGNHVTGNIAIKKFGENGVDISEKTLTATGPVFDFLSVFYYLRKLDYSKLDKYKRYTSTVFSGSKQETVKIKSLGKTKLKMRDKTVREAYHIQFNFTQKGGKKSSDDIDCWLSVDKDHEPLYLVGKLPVGEVRVYLTSAR